MSGRQEGVCVCVCVCVCDGRGYRSRGDSRVADMPWLSTQFNLLPCRKSLLSMFSPYLSGMPLDTTMCRTFSLFSRHHLKFCLSRREIERIKSRIKKLKKHLHYGIENSLFDFSFSLSCKFLLAAFEWSHV